MLQVEGSNRAVASFLRSLGISFRTDTVYVFVVPPMVAARAEGAINPFAAHLRRAGTKADIVALAVYDRRRAAESFLRRRAFDCDYSRVAGTEFLRSFVFSAGMLQVPFVAKFVVSSGQMISSYSLLGATDSATAAWFIADTSKPRAKKPVPARPQLREVKGTPYHPVVTKRVRLHDSDEHPLSDCDYLCVNSPGTLLSLRDNLTNFIYVFDLDSGRMMNVLYPDSAEEAMFLEVPPAVHRLLKRMNVLNSMYFSHSFGDDSTLLIAASLPKVVLEVAGSDTNFGYYNAAVLVRKSVNSNRLVRCVKFQPLPDSVEGGYSHTSASIVDNGGQVFAPFSRGWPRGSQMLGESTPAAENPFLDEFYRRDNHGFAVFDSTGSFVRFVGRLGARFEQLRLGYLAADGLAKSSRGRLYLCDRYSGRIYSYRGDTLDDSITVFDLPASVFPSVDRTREPLHFLLDAFKLNFPTRVVDFLVTQSHCFALLLDHDRPILSWVALANRRGGRYVLPERFEDREIKYCLLRETESGSVLVALLVTPELTDYCEFQIPYSDR